MPISVQTIALLEGVARRAKGRRNKIIWRQGDSFEFRVSFSLTQFQEYNVTSKCLSTQKPLTPSISDTIYETDTDKIYMWDGLNWFK